MPSRRVPSRLTGPATRGSARAAGVTPWHLRHRDVVRLSRDTYLPASSSNELRSRLAAVLLTAPPGAVVSHASAAVLWGLAIPLRQEDLCADLTVPPGSGARRRSDRRIHRLRVAPDEVTRRASLPVTTLARTWRDLAGELPPAALLAVTDQLLAARCGVAELEEQLCRRPDGRGSARARKVLPIATDRAESPMESVLRWLLHEAGLPRPVVQHPVHDAAGRLFARADLAWPDRGVLVEFDGAVHRERDVFVNDLRRQNGLVAAGWTVLRFTSADVLGRPDVVVAEIRRALRARA